MRKSIVALGIAAFVLAAGPAWACGGLIAPNGAVGLVKTATLSAYVNGIEHYVTQFEFAGAKGEFGSIVPLPDVPTRIIKGGDWTLDRLAIEVQPPVVAFAEGAGLASAPAKDVEVLEEKRIGALDITILRGGGDGVGDWARENGFDLTPDAPEVLDFYAERSPIFMAAKFDATEAARRGLQVGEGTSIHLSIPTDDPWVPLRILALGQSGPAVVEADVFLLTERRPALLPEPVAPEVLDIFERADQRPGLVLRRSEPASEPLLFDLSSDRGMHWLPTSGMWFSYLEVNEEAEDLTYDLAMNVAGGLPSPVDAGFAARPERGTDLTPLWIAGALLGGLSLLVAAAARRETRWA
jgi:hypothetical protein